MSRPLVAVAVLSALIATGTSPSYCAEMLQPSAAVAAGVTVDTGAVTSSHEHHHHAGTTAASAPGTLKVTAGPVSCSNCGQLTAKAVAPDSRANLMCTAELAAAASDVRRPRARCPSLSDRSINSFPPPLLIPLRI